MIWIAVGGVVLLITVLCYAASPDFDESEDTDDFEDDDWNTI